MIRKTLSLVGLTAVLVLALGNPAHAWNARAGCNVVHLESGGANLGPTRLVYQDGHRQDLNINAARFNVNNAGAHGYVVRVRFSNGESHDLTAPVGCAAPTSTTAATVPVEAPTTVAVAPETTTTVAPAPTTPTTVTAPARELPRTGATSTTLVVWGTAFLVLGLTGVCFVGNRSWRTR